MKCVVLPEYLSASECDAVLERYRTGNQAEAAAYLQFGAATDRPELRRSKVGFLLNDDDIKKRIRGTLLSINDRYYHFAIDSIEPLQIAEYIEGDQYNWHLDIGPFPASLRKLSVSIQLSSPADYDGGELEIFGSGNADKERGSLIAFPSYLAHRVCPVRRGRRHSLVAWAAGPAFR